MPKKLLDFAPRAKQPFKIQSKSATEAEIILYAAIGPDYWGDGSSISAKQFSDELKKLDATVKNITVRINSPGGDVFDGIAIYNRLVQSKANITVYIDGLAASIASIIALAGNEIVIGEGALYMVHLPWTWAMGNRMELDNTVSRLMDVEEQMISIYAKKSGQSRADIKKLMEDETWMNSDQAMELGFVNSKVDESIPIAASALDKKWIMRAPKTYKSQTAAVDAAKLELRNKIAEKIARK